MRQKHRSLRSVARSEETSHSSESGDRLPGRFATCGLALLVARLFVPAESAHLGETLWIVAAWFGLALPWQFLVLRGRLRARRLDWIDAAVWLLVAGHVLSAVVVVCTEGQQRAAINMLWEWVGVGLAVTLLRQWLSADAGRRRCLQSWCLAATVLALLGFWQFAVVYPGHRATFAEIGRLEQRVADGEASSRDRQRLTELRREVGEANSFDDPTARDAFRQRVTESSEPIGEFALANSLAGVLAPALLLLWGGCAMTWPDPARRRNLIPLLIAVGLVAYCLILTKSRTAYVGCAAGLLCGVLLSGRRLLTGRRIGVAIVGIAAFVGLGWAAWWSGALDRQVLEEAPKSLAYRLEYWRGTWDVIRAHPLLGVGPGNFRQHYLQYKLAGSSEEVLDPHNLFLDVLVNGGVLGLLGLLAVCAAFAARCVSVLRTGPPAAEPPQPSGSYRRQLIVIGVAAIGLVLFKVWALEARLDPQLACLLIAWVLFAAVLPDFRVSAAVALGATVALLVHLCGAGGIAMPAIGGLLLLLLAGVPGTEIEATPSRSVDSHSSRPAASRLYPIAALALPAAGIVACWFTAIIPVLVAGTHIAAGDAAVAAGNAQAARRSYEQGTLSDPFDPVSWRRLAEMDYLLAGLENDSAAWDRAMREMSAAILLDPHNPKLQWTLGEWQLARFRKTQQPQLLNEAVASLRHAARGYPNHAGIQATLAEALDLLEPKSQARAAAQRALELDDLNRQRGHTDRVLPAATRELLESLLSPE